MTQNKTYEKTIHEEVGIIGFADGWTGVQPGDASTERVGSL